MRKRLLFIDHVLHRTTQSSRFFVDLLSAPFVASLPPCRPSWAQRLEIALEYPLYLAEGAFERVRH